MEQTSISNLNTKTVVNDNDYLIIDDLSSTNKILVKTILDTFKQKLLDELYPIGSIYMSVNSANPNTLFGGTWEKIKDRFLLASGDTYTAGDMDGEATHMLTTNEIPSHNHIQRKVVAKGVAIMVDQTSTGDYQGDKLGIDQSSWYTKNAPLTTSSTGENNPHNNMPPYLVVNIWKRTA